MSCYLNSGSLWLWPHTRLLCQTLGSGASYHRRLSSALQISLAPRLLTVAGECWNPPNTVDGKTAPVRSRTPTLWKFNMWWELKLGNVAERRERLLIRGNHRVPATRGPQSENQRRSWIMWAADESQNQNETWKQRTFQPRPPEEAEAEMFTVFRFHILKLKRLYESAASDSTKQSYPTPALLSRFGKV